MRNLFFVFLICLFKPYRVHCQATETVAPGIWKITFGTPEKFLPTELKEKPLMEALSTLPVVDKPPFDLGTIRYRKTAGGLLAEMTVDSTERFYGFGMQTNSFEQRGMRREIRLNSKVTGDLGFGHASMPFFLSSKGYGVLVNTSRYTTFYTASKGKLDERVAKGLTEGNGEKVALSTVVLYGKKYTPSDEVSILVNGTEGMELYVFAGPQLREVMQRYNLFSGGGSLPPLWGLGFKYRAKATFNEQEVFDLARYFRDKHIPCDMLGLEPGWQTTSYPCSFVWNQKAFPDPDAFVGNINAQGFKLNLWEHAYTHPNSPLFDSIAKYACNYTVWSGAVPDFLTPSGQRIFADYHEKQFVNKGVAAFKLDESDGANYELAQREWSFPDIAQFPSGIDGVQMRQLYGQLYNKTLLSLYRKRNQRTLFDVRASYLFASPYSTALYSDMYGHGDFVRMIANSGFAGVNWSPELRETDNEADLIRRMQTITLSAQMVVNGWYLDLPPWLQFNVKANAEHRLLPNHLQLEATAKKLIELRMRLMPYLYAAFARYRFEGTPPFRPLVMDYPNDKNVWRIDDQYMMGESILCAPFIDSASTRSIYLPEGVWYDFNNNKKYEGGKRYTVSMSLNEVPMFVKANTILPLAKPVAFISPQTVLAVDCLVYGTPTSGAALFEDDAYTERYSDGIYNWLKLSWDGKQGKVERKGKYKGKLYEIKSWNVVAN